MAQFVVTQSNKTIHTQTKVVDFVHNRKKATSANVRANTIECN